MDSPLIAVTKFSPVPLYYQVAEQIQERIRSGELVPGDQLPADRELAAQAGISRMTARQAIAYLVKEGALSVRQGVGTFVAEPKLAYDALHLLSFTEETVRHGGEAGSRVLDQGIVEPSAGVAEALGIKGGGAAVKIQRLRSVGSTPVLLVTSFVSASAFPGLESEDLATQSLYQTLEIRFNVRLQQTRQTIEAAIANEYESELFGIDLGAPMLLLEGMTYADDATPVEFFKAVYRGDRIKLEMESWRDGASVVSIDSTQRMSVVLL